MFAIARRAFNFDRFRSHGKLIRYLPGSGCHSSTIIIIKHCYRTIAARGKRDRQIRRDPTIKALVILLFLVAALGKAGSCEGSFLMQT
jgi:hypothetical protein